MEDLGYSGNKEEIVGMNFSFKVCIFGRDRNSKQLHSEIM